MNSMFNNKRVKWTARSRGFVILSVPSRKPEIRDSLLLEVEVWRVVSFQTDKDKEGEKKKSEKSSKHREKGDGDAKKSKKPKKDKKEKKDKEGKTKSKKKPTSGYEEALGISTPSKEFQWFRAGCDPILLDLLSR